MSAHLVLSRAEAAGVRLRLLPDGTVRMDAAAPPPAELLADLRRWRDDLARLLAERATTLRDRRPGNLSPDLVARLAEAMAASRPWQRIANPEAARAHFAAEARRRLAPLDPLARGLLVQAAEADARRWQATPAAPPYPAAALPQPGRVSPLRHDGVTT